MMASVCRVWTRIRSAGCMPLWSPVFSPDNKVKLAILELETDVKLMCLTLVLCAVV